MPRVSLMVRKDLIIPKRQRRLKHISGNGTHYSNRYTVTKEVKCWIAEMVSHHWYLHEDRLGNLFITLHDEEDAMKYKLAWH